MAGSLAIELHLRRREIALPEVASVFARIIAQMIVQATAEMSAGTSGK
jgi:hypothetical protein